MRCFFIDHEKVTNPTPVICGTDAKHIKNVLRLKPGDKIGLFDGTGFEYEARILAISPGGVEVSIIKSFPSTSESPVQIIMAQALLKDRKMDNLVRQLTELGITRWIPFFAQRSIPRPDEKRLLTREKRWKKIAQEAVKQCKRGRTTEIDSIVSYEEMLNLGKECDLKVAFWENEKNSIDFVLSPSVQREVNKIFVIMGPEGGLTKAEIDRAKACGFVTAGLGPRILRAETATIAACSILQHLFGDMGKKNLDKD